LPVKRIHEYRTIITSVDCQSFYLSDLLLVEECFPNLAIKEGLTFPYKSHLFIILQRRTRKERIKTPLMEKTNQEKQN
jgi:hypothetical protein